MTSITDQPREASHCKTASVAVLSVPANAQVAINSDQDIVLARQKGRALATGLPPGMPHSLQRLYLN